MKGRIIGRGLASVTLAPISAASRPATWDTSMEWLALEEITSSFNGVEKSFAIQAGREVRIMIKPEVVSEDQMVLLAREIAKKTSWATPVPPSSMPTPASL